jgi:N utilization substance protein A
VITMEDLAELAVPELLEIDPEVGEEKAAALILKAREPWFAEEAEAAAE